MPIPSAPIRDSEAALAMGINDTPVCIDGRRAENAQRPCCPTVQDDAARCSDAESWEDVISRGISAQEETDVQSCASVHHNSAKRVIGLEPTTSTLATCNAPGPNSLEPQDLAEPDQPLRSACAADVQVQQPIEVPEDPRFLEILRSYCKTSKLNSAR